MRKILAVDDHADNLISVKALLGIFVPECDIITAGSGREGIQKAITERPDTILLDIYMPGMDGFEVCRKLKEDSQTANIPIVMLTAIKTDTKSKVKALELGADAFLTKPINEAELGAQIKAMLRIKKAEDILRNERDQLEEMVHQRIKDLMASNDQLLKEIDERKQAEKENHKLSKQLQQMQKMESIGNLAGGIAHDFNNILFPIIGMSEILLDDLPEGSLEYENAQQILTAGKRGRDLVNQILSFSRQRKHEFIPIRVENVLKEVLKLIRSTIPSNIQFREDIDWGCGLVMADATQIHQVVMNLVTNAFYAIEGISGIIDIKLKEVELKHHKILDKVLPPGKYIKLSIMDNGKGMSQSIQNKVFEPYFTTKKNGKGTGLGLAVAYGIIKEHNGDIKVDSEQGKGSTFSVYMPLMTTTKEFNSTSTSQGLNIQTGTENILIVDDEISIAKLEGQMLSRLGYQVTECTDSCEALNVFKNNPEAFDLVLTDMTMPTMTGDQLAREILSIKPSIPIIICTGFSEGINKEQVKLFGIKGFLMKPVIKSDMAQMVRKMLRNES